MRCVRGGCVSGEWVKDEGVRGEECDSYSVNESVCSVNTYPTLVH